MSESGIKMTGLALMALSVFLILFGLYFPSDGPAFAGAALAWGGAAMLLVGSIVFLVVRKR